MEGRKWTMLAVGLSYCLSKKVSDSFIKEFIRMYNYKDSL